MGKLIFRKRLKFGPLILNMSQGKVTSYTIKVGPWSWNSRSRKQRVNLPGPFSWTSNGPAPRCVKTMPHLPHFYTRKGVRYECQGS